MAAIIGNYYMVSLMLDVVGQQLRPESVPSLPVRKGAVAKIDDKRQKPEEATGL